MLAMIALSVAPQRSAAAEARAALAAMARHEPQIHAVISTDPTAIAQARSLDAARLPRGPLFGLPILVKDNIETAGPLPTTAGSLALANNVSGRDAPVVARLRAAGAVILGKTNLSEWANIRSSHSLSGWSGIGGQTRNPFALNRTPCGSSSGSAVAVAAGYTSAAIGTETDGSITCPAAMNGVVGLKPTVGLVSRSRVIPISHSQDTPGPITRDVRTAALILEAMAGSDPTDPATATANAHRTDYAAALSNTALHGVRLGVLRYSGPWPQSELKCFAHALAILKAQGATLVDIPKPPPGGARISADENVVLMTEFKADLNAYLATTPPQVKVRTLSALIAFDKTHPREMGLFGQDEFEAAEKTHGIDDPGYRKAAAEARRLAGPQGIDALLAQYHVSALIAPTEQPAWLIDAVNGDAPNGAEGPGHLAAVAGYPHLTVPMGLVDGLPVGMSFVGTAWSEAQLLAYGYAFEAAADIHPRPGFARSVEDMPAVAPLLAPSQPAGR